MQSDVLGAGDMAVKKKESPALRANFLRMQTENLKKKKKKPTNDKWCEKSYSRIKADRD